MARPRRRWLRWGAAALGALVVVLAGRAALMSPPSFDAGPAVSLPEVSLEAAAARLSGALQIPTISIKDGRGDPESFRRFHAMLQREFPRVHETMTRETINEHSLVYRWKGTDASAAPILLLAHMDVVPVEPGTEADWKQPPFSGAIVDGEIWGRGAMDDKTAVMGIMEAAEALLGVGFTPRRTVVIAFGHDEEVGGKNGAQAIAARFEANGEHFSVIVDEGGAVVDGSLPGVEVPVALVGIAEKGYASIELIVSSDGGHSSMPAPKGAIARLGRAVRLLDEHQMPGRIDGPTRTMLEAVGPHMPFALRIGVANLWLLKPLLVKVMLSQPPAAASVRTTTAPTIFEAGSADNVLPQQARAVVNFRILPGDTVETVLAHVRAVVGDAGIEARCLDHCWDPSKPSPVDTEGFTALSQAIVHTFPEAVVAPYLVVGATDAHHYQHLGDGAYRFLPLVMKDEERSRLHGTGERTTVGGYGRAIRFYLELLQRAAGASPN